ncbi:hypothetical protein TIFTF001_025332 [Ficus carica]|uniref:Uncharacterized protein n=1 Tax=Ficus carica TaxID=3494 RepID=A0AA88AWM8_FICCA|nr:hypothetical protein TIFTF001_025332 [Ficus carica]
MTQSHLLPFTAMARLLALRGLTVAIVTTHLNALRLQKQSLFRPKTPFSCSAIFMAGIWLASRLRSLDSLPSSDLVPNFHNACGLLQTPNRPLEKWIGDQFLGENSNKPSCIISNYCFPWTENLAKKFKIPKFVFRLISCFSWVCSQKIAISKVLESVKSDSEAFLVPGIPDEIEFTRDGVLVNTFEELEKKYVEEYQKTKKKKKIWCMGPVADCSVDAHTNCSMKWFNKRNKPNTVYACFGSPSHLSSSQVKELALGLESSSYPFIWVIRGKGYYSTRQFNQWWNSTLEGVSAGRAMITWPMFGEQFQNEKLIVQVLKIGVRVEVKETMEYFAGENDGNEEARDDDRKGLVKKEDIRKAIDNLMSEDDEGEERRRRARGRGDG